MTNIVIAKIVLRTQFKTIITLIKYSSAEQIIAIFLVATFPTK